MSPYWMGLAASLVLAVSAVVGLGLNASRQPEAAIYASDIDQNTEVFLDDGTSLTLSGATRIAVAFTNDRRSVKLDYGSAYFDVTPDADRPFVVTAGDTAARVTGTAFEVRRSTDGVRVAVTEGSVAVDDLSTENGMPVELALLSPGELLHTDTFGTATGEKVRFERGSTLSWLDGRLEYDGAALSDVIADMNRYRSTKVQLVDDNLGDLRITVSFRTSQTDELIDALTAIYPINVQYGVGRVLLDHTSGD